jgi:PKD repeat protein
LRRLVALLSVVTALVVVPALAQAEVVPVVGGNAYYTNSATDSMWFSASAYSFPTYRVKVRYYVNGAYFSEDVTGAFTGNNVLVHPSWATAPGAPSTLVNGVTYQMCATGEFYSPPWLNDTSPSTCDPIYYGTNTATTMDRSKPTVTNVGVEGSATYSNKTAGQTLALSGVYNDSISPPWPATYTCVRTNADPATACNGVTYGYQSGCSNAGAGASRTNNPFSCTYPIQAGDPDGPLVFCAMVADASVPDTSNTNPYAGFTSSNANISTPSCGYVILDRAAPSLTITGPTAGTAGSAVAFSAAAADPAAGITQGSGPSGAYTWAWGDGTTGTGASASHAYASAGTYTVTLTSGDTAGNTATKTATVTVAAAARAGSGGAGSGSPAAGSGSTTGSGTVVAAPTAAAIEAAIGTRSTQTQSAGGLDVLTAKTVKITAKLRTLPIALTAHATGVATFALLRGTAKVGAATLTITKTGSLGLRLKLPAHVRSGRYSLKVAFTPAGAPAARKTLGIRFTGATARTRTSASGISGGAPAAVGLGTADADYGVPGVLTRATAPFTAR